MRPLLLALILSALALPARADVQASVQTHILPGYARFEASTAELAAQAGQSCDPARLVPAYHAAYDAWMAVQHLRFGPVETDGRVLAILYWPDPKGLGAKAQRQLLTGDPAALLPAAFAEQSVAARGLLAMERLLFPVSPLPAEPCALVRATAADLHRIAALIRSDWDSGFAQTVLTAGEASNPVFLSATEARQTLFTQIITGLEFAATTRLGRPLGSFEAPHPERAEARPSGRALRNVLLSLQAMRHMAQTLDSDIPATLAAFDTAIAQATALNDPVFDGAAVPAGRIKIEILQQSVLRIREQALSEMAGKLGVTVGFNAADGD